MNRGEDGILFLIVGPSGVGKDTLIVYAKARLQGEKNFLFPIRFVTRAPDLGEETYHSLSPEAFEKYVAEDRFALWWKAHDLEYGIGREIESWIKEGKHVVVNVSRSIIDSARLRFRHVVVLRIQASRESLERRLRARRRETREGIRARLDRSSAISVSGPGVLTVQNDGSIETAGEEFLGILRRRWYGD